MQNAGTPQWVKNLRKESIWKADEPVTLTDEEIKREWYKCSKSAWYFVHNYCKIEDPQTEGTWVDFKLWPEQIEVLNAFQNEKWVVVLKARQLGITWLAIAFALWLMLFRASAVILLFSRRDGEAVMILDRRLKGMYSYLPKWLKARVIVRNSSHEFGLSNGSVAFAFPPTSGDSYTATCVIVDEGDLIDDLDKLLASVRPTIDNGGQLIIVSRVDKSKPNSAFKRIFLHAKNRGGSTGWFGIFLPWWVHPGRTKQWYQDILDEVERRTASNDEMWEQYPGTVAEALAETSTNKRFPARWVQQCYHERLPIPERDWPKELPAIQGLTIYKLPERKRKYVGAVDTAEGLPTSDDSVTQFIDRETCEQVAVLIGKFPADVHARYTGEIATVYNNAQILVERNNHGGTFILASDLLTTITLLDGPDGRPGWVTTGQSKITMYDAAANRARDRGMTLYSPVTYQQLTSIQQSNLQAPEGSHDDAAVAWVLALMAADIPEKEVKARWGTKSISDYRGI